MKTKIGIITICQCNNYGADLQAYATWEKLQQMGFDAEIINYLYYKSWQFKDSKESRPFVPFSLKERFLYIMKYRILAFVLDAFFPYFIPAIKRRNKRFATFLQDNCKFSREYKSMKELYQNPPKYDVYITGSDQVWNPAAQSSIEPYFLSFAPQGAKKVSYAASFGISNLPTGLNNKYQILLNDYDHIGVREKNGCEIVKLLCNKEATLTLDPTLLLNKEAWLKVAKKYPNIPEKYILIYQLSDSPEIVALAKHISKEKNLPVIRIAKRAYCVNKDKGIENILDAGPAEFISLISGASFVLTNSFHGTAFSINMQVTFCAVISSKKNNNSRIENLLIQLGLEDRLVREEQDFKDLKIFDSINYNRIEEKLSSLKNLSESFIRQALYS